MAEFKIEDAKQFEHLWRANGQLEDGSQFTLQDALSVPSAPLMMPKVISNVVKEAVEPLLVGTSLLQRINYSAGQQITFPSVGALQAADIGEGMEYPEKSLQIGGSTVTANIGKSGVAVKVTDEMIRYSQFDVIGLHLRAAGRALARHKEEKIFNHIRAMGITVFDNVSPTSSLKGVCTGRSLDGSGNGSVTMDDVFDAYAQVITHGFFPNTLLMHPLTWTMFIKDATLRAFVLANGGGTFFASHSGNPVGRAPWEGSSTGGLGVSGGQLITPPDAASGATASPLGDHPQTINSAPNLPGYFGVPFRIIVSPFVPYDPAKKLTDIYMFDSSELGVLIVDEEINVEEFDDPARDIRKIKLMERYGVGILNEGKAIAVLRNVHVVPNEIVLPAQANIDVSGSIATISPTASVL